MPVQFEIACAKQQRDLLPLGDTQLLSHVYFLHAPMSHPNVSGFFSLADPGRPVASSNCSPVTLGENQPQT